MPQNRKLQNLLSGKNASVAADATDGALPLLYAVQIDGGASETATLIINKKVRVVDVWVQLNADGGTDGNNIVVEKQDGTSLCGAIVIGTAADAAVVRTAAIADNVADVAVNGILKITSISADSTAPATTTYILCYPIA